MRQFKQLQEENARLKHLVAELMLDKTMLQDVLAKKLGRPRGAARWWSTYTRPTG
jgi:putative transposase